MTEAVGQLTPDRRVRHSIRRRAEVAYASASRVNSSTKPGSFFAHRLLLRGDFQRAI